MKKILLITTLFFTSLLSTSCLYAAPSHEEVYEELTKKLNYEETYIFSYASAYKNELAPKEEQENPYGVIYSLYGKINNVYTLYIYGIAERGVLFEPFIYKWPLKSSYDECLELFKTNMPTKTFNKSREDNISLLTNSDVIDSLFNEKYIQVDSNFVLKCDSSHYVYEINGSLNYIYIE